MVKRVLSVFLLAGVCLTGCRDDGSEGQAAHMHLGPGLVVAERMPVDALLKDGAWRARLDGMNADERRSGFGDLVRSRRVSFEELLAYAGDDQTMLVDVAREAGAASHMATLQALAARNPSDGKNQCVSEFIGALKSVGDVREAIVVLSVAKLYPGEQTEVANAFIGPLWKKEAAEVRSLAEMGGMPGPFRDMVVSCYAYTLRDTPPDQARERTASLPAEVRDAAVGWYWYEAAADHLEWSKQAWQDGEVPAASREKVGQAIIRSINRNLSREEGFQFAAGVQDPAVARRLTEWALYGWLDSDSTAAAAGASALAPGPVRDAAFDAVSRYLVSKGAVEEAEQWKKRIGKP